MKLFDKLKYLEKAGDFLMVIWELIEQCSRELTKNGVSPFTRADIIRCVQMKNSAYGPNSINPIIQGLTDNLKGGAPGAVGKGILHSVGRNQFVLNSEYLEENHMQMGNLTQNARGKVVTETTSQEDPCKKFQFSHNPVRNLDGYEFRYICNIEPEREPNGHVRRFLPQSSYKGINENALHKYGIGPFCKFSIPQGLDLPGVYALIDKDEIKYIGECKNLNSRFTHGYGNISPRNCYSGGQLTNCRINNLLFQHASAGFVISLWFLCTQDYKTIESELRASFLLSWNLK